MIKIGQQQIITMNFFLVPRLGNRPCPTSHVPNLQPTDDSCRAGYNFLPSKILTFAWADGPKIFQVVLLESKMFLNEKGSQPLQDGLAPNSAH